MTTPANPYPTAPKRSFLVSWLLSYFLGILGVDRFYLGYTGLGIAKLLTCGGCGIWALIDLILILAGQMRDRQGQELEGYAEGRTVAWIVVGALLALSIVVSALSNGFAMLSSLTTGGY